MVGKPRAAGAKRRPMTPRDAPRISHGRGMTSTNANTSLRGQHSRPAARSSLRKCRKDLRNTCQRWPPLRAVRDREGGVCVQAVWSESASTFASRVSTFHRAHVPILICLLAGHPGPLSMDEEARLQVPPSTTSSLEKTLGDSLCQCMQEDMLFNKSCLYYICFIII